MIFFPGGLRAGLNSKEVGMWIISSSTVGVCWVGAWKRDEWVERNPEFWGQSYPTDPSCMGSGLGKKEERLVRG